MTIVMTMMTPMTSQLVQASLSGAMAVAVVWGLCRLMPRLTASVKAWLWCAAAAKFLVTLVWSMPLQIPVLPAPVASPVTYIAVAPIARPLETGDSVAAAATAPAPARVDVWTLLVPAALGLWSLGMLVATAVGIRRWMRARQLIRQSSAASPKLAETMSEVACAMGLRVAPPVMMSADVDTPLVIGVTRPVVIVPSPRFARLTDDEQRMALAHECAHIRRADLRVGCVPALCEAVFFFHPFARMAAREYALWREAACDAAVIDALDTAPADYGRLLLGLGVSRPHVGLAAAGASWSTSNLKRRLLMLTESPVPTTRSRVAAAVLVAGAVAMIVPVQLTARAAVPVTETRITTMDQQYPRVPPPPPPPAPVPPVPMAAPMPPPPPPAPVAPPEFPDWAMPELPAPPPVPPLPPTAPLPPPPPMSRALPVPPAPPVPMMAPLGPSFAPMAPPPVPPIAPMPPLPPLSRRRDSDQNFVLIIDGSKHIMSGNSSDVRSAESFVRNNEPLLWFRQSGHEYIVRDRALVGQAIDVWKPVNELGDAQGRLGAEQGELGRRQGEIGAQQGRIGAEQGKIGEEQAVIALKQAELNLKAVRAQTEADRREVEKGRRELDQSVKQLNEEMQKLSGRMEGANAPMNELSRQMEDLSGQMEKYSKRMQEASSKAETDMAKLIDSAIKSGAAQQVR